MARSTYLGTTNDWLTETTSSGYVKIADDAKTLRFWSAETGGTRHTDLLIDGAAATELVVPANAAFAPAVDGPDGVNDGMWLEVVGVTTRVFVTPSKPLTEAKAYADTQVATRETPAGAQAKADAAVITAATDATTKANAAEANAKAASIPLTQKGAANGVAALGADGRSTEAQLPAHLAQTSLNAAYARKAQALGAAFAEANVDPQPAIPGTVPTITYSGSGALARVISGAGFGRNGAVGLIGQAGTWDTALGKLEINSGLITALDFYLHDSDVEFGYVEQTTGGSRVWVWVDGQPVTAVPNAAPLSVAAGANIVGKLAFGSVARRRITIWASNMNAWKWIRTNATGVTWAAQQGLRIAMVGDSWWGGSTPSPGLACASAVIARTFKANAHIEAIGGTGYLTGSQPFGHATRVARVQAFDPDLILFMGSINDGTDAGMQTAAAACYDAYATACPGVPMIVFGPQPSSSTDTISATRAATVAAIKAAADAHPAVLAFHDQIGTAAGTVPPAWVTSTTYTTGDLVTYQGSVYQWQGATGNAGPLTPAQSGSWTLKTWVLTGTGYDAAPATNGSRDVALGSDNAHPTPTGSLAFGILEAAKVRETMLTYAG